MTAEEKLKEYIIDCRRKVKEKKQLQRLHKPKDIASQIILGARAKAFQQVIDKLYSIRGDNENSG